MFDDPRSGSDRRRADRRGSASAVAADEEKRKQGDRRVFIEPREGGPWWLMRHYVSGEKFRVAGSPDEWFGAAEDPPT
jgi:hypothetical protein